MHEDGVEGSPVVEVAAVSSARGPLEAELGHLLHPVGPPGLRRAGGKLEVGGELPKQVEAHRLRRQQVGPQAFLLDELVCLRPRQPIRDLLQDGRRQEVRSRRLGLVEL
jgi:hypothetical protein